MFSQEVMDMLIKGIGETLYMTVFVRMQVFTKYWMSSSILDEASRF